MTGKAAWTPVPAPRVLREVGMPFAIPSTLWQPGILYSASSEVRVRYALERWVGSLEGWGARLLEQGARRIELMTPP